MNEASNRRPERDTGLERADDDGWDEVSVCWLGRRRGPGGCLMGVFRINAEW